MSIHKYSFRNPVATRKYEDGRHHCANALKKIFAAGPTAPATLMKLDKSDAGVNAAMAKKLNRQERLRRSNSHEALQEIQKIHGKGPRRSLDEAQGDAPVKYKSVEAMKKARQRVLPVMGNRMLSVLEITKAFAAPASKRHVDIEIELRKPGKVARTVNAGRYDYDFDAKGIVLGKRLNARYAKGLTNPALNDIGAKPPQSANGQWNGGIAATGATNDWRDQPEPTLRPTIVGSQPVATPSMLTRDAALDAIKFALRKPQKLFGNTQDTEDLDEDDEDLDDDDDQGKNPNRDDSQR